MSGEPDSGSGPGSIIKQMEPPTTNNNDETECDTDRVTASSASYDSSEGNSTLRCDRCDTFETQSRTLMMAHTAQCGVSSQQQDGEQEAESQPATEANKQPRKLFECDVCNMKFSNGANMRRHKMRHTGVKPYECRVCQKRFFRKDHLAEHFTTHTKTLPYHCPICNRGFQRQIAMRAHFQNEHVGQHDLVKTCPLCSYRAGTMKSLRVHFFNRHGIDLDNPGPGAPSSLLLALDPQNAGNLLPSLAAAAAAGQSYSDSGDSLRSTDNATPPMHFLTPHVEISMADNNENFNCDPITTNTTTLSTTLEIQPCQSRPNGGSPLSPNSADSNSNAPSSSHTLLPSIVQNSRHLLHDSTITPSISLIPIKQEPISTDDYQEKLQIMTRSNEQQISLNTNTSVSNSGESSTPTSSLTSLIKVSPLKSLLREDLKRRISARASNRASRNNNNNNSNNNNLTGTNSLTIIADTPTNAATIATTSNGTITSTGPETEIILSTRRRNLQCLFCGIEFPDQTLYFLHKGCHSESNPWKCNICGEQCNNVYEFNSHLLSKSHQ